MVITAMKVAIKPYSMVALTLPYETSENYNLLLAHALATASRMLSARPIRHRSNMCPT
jgi:hypothetical protein